MFYGYKKSVSSTWLKGDMCSLLITENFFFQDDNKNMRLQKCNVKKTVLFYVDKKQIYSTLSVTDYSEAKRP